MFAAAQRSPVLAVCALAFTLTCCSLTASCPGQAASLPDTAFDADRAWKDVEAQVALGPRSAGTPALEKTRVYIEEQLKAAKLTPVREAFTATAPSGEQIAMANIYADIEAASGPGAPMIIIGSHFDTKRMAFTFVGANDGASSTGVLLELARTFAAAGHRDVAYRFLFLDGEEAIRPHWEDPDNRYGSRYHAEQLKKTGAVARVKAFVLLDMIGDKDLRVTNDEYSDQWLRDAFYSAARANGLGKHVDGTKEPTYDDHLSFLAIGVPSIDFIDFDYGTDRSYWHTEQDTLDKLSKDSLRAIGRIVMLGLPAVEARILQRH